jgi:hypothetical protein
VTASAATGCDESLPSAEEAPMTRSRTTTALLACFTSLFIAACGGGGSSGPTEASPTPAPSPSPAPAPGPGGTNPPPPAPTLARLSPDQEAYWASGAGVRANLAHMVSVGAGDGVAVALDAGESAWLQARAAQARAEGSAAGAAKAASGDIRALAPAVQRRTVTGLFSFLFHSAATGSDQQPLDLTATVIEAFVPDGAGGFAVIPATARRTDGTYAIAGVPEGPHWVRLGTRYVWTDQAFVDWSFDLFGRGDVVFPANPTRLEVNAGNLAPWQTTDTLAWVVPQHGFSRAMPLTDPGILNAPRLGETALGAFGFELGPNGLFDGLLDPAKGDQAYINQLATLPGVTSSGPVRVLSRSMVLPPTTTADGSTTTVNSGFLDIAANAKLRLRWQRASFARYGDAVHPGVPVSTSFVAVSSFALPPTFGSPGDAYSLLEFDTVGSQDIDFGLLRYGNPFPSGWNRTIDTFVAFTKNYLAPGATVSEPLQRGLSMSVLIDPASRDDATVTLAPRISPPRHPQINGKTLFANQLGVGATPRVSWTPPETGTANRYFMRVLELLPNGTRSRFRPVATLSTSETAVTLPPGLLTPGSVYVLTVAAMNTGAPVTQPNRNSLPFSFATTMSAIVSP